MLQRAKQLKMDDNDSDSVDAKKSPYTPLVTHLGDFNSSPSA